MNHFRTIGDVLRNCTIVGRIIVLPKIGVDNNFKKYDPNLFESFKVLMYRNGGEYYPSEKNRGFVFPDFDAKTTQTEDLLKRLINETKEEFNHGKSNNR